MVDALTAKGTAVISIDYHLAHNDPNKGAKYPTPLEDITKVMQWVHENATQYGISPDEVSIGGGSAGAHMALLYSLNAEAYGHTAEMPDISKVVAIAPATDLASVGGSL